MKLIGNLIWLIFGGFIISLEYLIASILLIATIIGIPFGLQTLKLAFIALWPFHRRIEPLPSTSGCLLLLMNLLWLLFGGLATVLSHFVMGLIFSITIIGIPFGKQHFKLARVALTPFDYQIR